MPVVQAAIYGPSAAFISEMFDTEHRYTEASLGYTRSPRRSAAAFRRWWPRAWPARCAR